MSDGIGVNVEVEMRFSSDHELKEEDQAALGTMALAGALVKAFRDSDRMLEELIEYVEEVWTNHAQDPEQ